MKRGIVSAKLRKSVWKHYVKVFIPTKNLSGAIQNEQIETWKDKTREVFKRFVSGYYFSQCFQIEGDFFSSKSNEWCPETNWVVVTYAPRESCKELIAALEDEIVGQMGAALQQESIGIESSIEGFAIYEIEPQGEAQWQRS